MGKVAVLVDLDYCVGCWACQTACSDHNRLPLGQTYLRVIKNEAEEVNGELKLYSFPYPLALEKCAQCVKDGGVPTCVSVCIGKALAIGDAENLLETAKKINRKTTIYI